MMEWLRQFFGKRSREPLGFSPPTDQSPAGRLRRYLAQEREYRYYIAPEPREWRPAKPVGSGALAIQQEHPIPIERLGRWIVAYPNGEILDAEGIFAPLPSGISTALSRSLARFISSHWTNSTRRR